MLTHATRTWTHKLNLWSGTCRSWRRRLVSKFRSKCVTSRWRSERRRRPSVPSRTFTRWFSSSATIAPTARSECSRHRTGAIQAAATTTKAAMGGRTAPHRTAALCDRAASQAALLMAGGSAKEFHLWEASDEHRDLIPIILNERTRNHIKTEKKLVTGEVPVPSLSNNKEAG